MVELRWLVRPGWDGPEKVLQYRVKYDPTIRAGMHFNINAGMMTGFNPELIWSEWKDVPEVES